MSSAYSEAIREAYSICPSSKTLVDTLEIRHPDKDPIYLVKDQLEMTARLEDGTWVDFEPLAFDFKLPKSADTGAQSLDVSIDNTNNHVAEYLNSVKASLKPLTIIYRPYLLEDLTKPQMSPPLTLTLTSALITVTQVSGRATYADIVNKRFPNDYYTPRRFKNLR
jgi:hypothetical protein